MARLSHLRCNSKGYTIKGKEKNSPCKVLDLRADCAGNSRESLIQRINKLMSVINKKQRLTKGMREKLLAALEQGMSLQGACESVFVGNSTQNHVELF